MKPLWTLGSSPSPSRTCTSCRSPPHQPGLLLFFPSHWLLLLRPASESKAVYIRNKYANRAYFEDNAPSGASAVRMPRGRERGGSHPAGRAPLQPLLAFPCLPGLTPSPFLLCPHHSCWLPSGATTCPLVLPFWRRRPQERPSACCRLRTPALSTLPLARGAPFGPSCSSGCVLCGAYVLLHARCSASRCQLTVCCYSAP